jgi:hypothetical protein
MNSTTTVVPIYETLLRPDLWVGREAWEANATAFVWRHWWFFVLAGVAYLPFVFGLQAWMKNRQAYDLRRPLILWNLFMATFSTAGFFSIVYPLVINWIYPGGGLTPREFICSASYCYKFGDCAIWVFVFNMSKILEFTDSIFIVLRKRPLHFLHYYHHVITYFFCLYAGQNMHNYNCGGYFFCLMNFFVHGIMYSYYALRAMGYHPSFDIGITFLQILQMVLGVAIISISATCERVDPIGTAFGYLIYFSFFVLFCKFFYYRYIATPAPTKKAPTVAGKSPAAKPKRKHD